MYLEHISSPEDVRALPSSALPALCEEIRGAIIESSAAVGGHMGSNLAVVELAVALHRVFTTPRDKIVFDVSHQTYAHKMLTGRAQAFLDPARYEDVSGFASPAESEHDLFAMGHTSTSVSLACGLVTARDLAGESHDVVAVIGDGSLSGGLAFEGLDNAAALGSGVIIVVNDNEWSIAPNHGGIYRNLAELRETGGRAERNVFRALGFDYRYLEDGHDVAALEGALGELRGCDRPVVLHVHTQKGRGYAPALADPESWHHATPFDVESGLPAVPGASVDYARITGEFLLGRMADDPRLVAEERIVMAEAREGTIASIERDEVQKILCLCTPGSTASVERRLKGRFPELAIATSSETLIEVMPTGTSKAQAVRTLCELWGIDPADAVAFGDNHNDVPMLEAVGRGYLMANAPAELLARAPLLAPGNDEDGVARVLEDLRLV